MPYSSVGDARKKVSGLKNKTDKQVRTFISAYNSASSSGKDDSSSIAIGMSAANKVSKAMAKTKKIGSGESLPASAFAYVGDPDKTSTWKFPISDKSHVQNAVARFNQTDLSGAAKASAKRKIRSAYKKFFPDNEVPEVIKSLEILEKATANDKRDILQSGLKEYYEGYPYLVDYDEDYLYFDYYDPMYEKYYTWRDGYVMEGNLATMDGNPQEVVRNTSYEIVEREMEDEEGLVEKVLQKLLKNFNGSQKQTDLVIEKFNNEEMIAVEILYVAPGMVDGQEETIDEDGVNQLVKSVNEGIESGELKANYFHSVWTEDFKFLKSWVNPYDCVIGTTEVPAGMPLIEVQYINKAAWDKRKSGELMGLSIEGTADIEEL